MKDALLPTDAPRMEAVPSAADAPLLPDQIHVDAAALNSNIIARFREVVRGFPTRPALRYKGNTFSYVELDRASDALARTILTRAGAAHEPLALLCQHGSVCIVAMLAVLKAGKCFACIDQHSDLAQQQILVSTLGSSVILCDSASRPRAVQLQARLAGLHILDAEQPDPCSAELPLPSASPWDLACIVFTSGSTGAAKGVMLAQRNVLLTALQHGLDFDLTGADVALHICPLWTAAAISEIFTALLNGCTLVPFSIKAEGAENFLSTLESEGITTFTASPVVFRALFALADPCRKFSSVRLLRLGGDRATSADLALLKTHFPAQCRLRLGYGASECLTATQLFVDQHYDLGAAPYLPLGFPLHGCEIVLLDTAGQEVAAGSVGEIVLRSNNLCLGYWRDPARTERQFRKPATASGVGTYFTNDLAIKDSAGCLHFIGRNDAVVKINGTLVSLVRVEQALAALEWVTEAAVVPIISATKGVEVVAFLVTASHELQGTHELPELEAARELSELKTAGELHQVRELEPAAVRAHLVDALPFAAMPTRVFTLQQLPQTPNHKLDRVHLERMAARVYSSADANLPLAGALP